MILYRLALGKAGYVWLYQDVKDASTEGIDMRVWISCNGAGPKYIDQPWNGEWYPNKVNTIRIRVSL